MSALTASRRPLREVPAIPVAAVTDLLAPAAVPAPGVARSAAPSAAGLLRCTAVPCQEPRAASRVELGERVDGELPPTQGTLALATGQAADRQPGLPLAGTDAPERAAETARSDAERAARLLPEPGAWAATFAQAAMEVAAGMRPPGQLTRWATPEVHAALVRRGVLTARSRRGGSAGGSKPLLRSVRSCIPRPGVCEVAVVVAEPERAHAVAFRMEGLQGRWQVTAMEIG